MNKHIKVYEDFLNESSGMTAEIAALAKQFQLGKRALGGREAEFTDNYQKGALCQVVNDAIARSGLGLNLNFVDKNWESGDYLTLYLNPYVYIAIFFSPPETEVYTYNGSDRSVDRPSKIEITISPISGSDYKKSDRFRRSSYKEIADAVVNLFKNNISLVRELIGIEESVDLPASIVKIMGYKREAKSLAGQDPVDIARATVLAIGATQNWKSDQRWGVVGGSKETTKKEREEKLKKIISVLNEYLKDKSYLEAAPWSLD